MDMDVPGRKEGNVLFSDTLTFSFSFVGTRHTVKDHSDSECGKPGPPLQGLLSPISSKESFICIIPTSRLVYTTSFVTHVVNHWLELEIDQL